MRDRRVPIAWNQLVARKNFRLEQALLRLQVIEVQPAVIAHPIGIHGIVLAWGLAIDDVFARADHRVATSRATCAEAFRFLQEPDPHLETEIRRRERADGTNVDRVQRIIIFETLAGMRGEDAVAAAIDEAENIVLRDLLTEPNAARTENAAFVIERNARTQLDVLRFLHLVFEEARIGPAVFHAEFLKQAFARLIADRAVERMIDEEKFHHALAAFLDERRIGANAHPFGDVLRAGNLRARHPVDDRFPVGAEFRFAVGPHLRQPHFDQTHPAIARRAEFLVIAISRHVAARLLARFDHSRPFRELVPHAVDLDVDHLHRCRRFRHLQFVIVLVLLLVIEAKPDRSRSRSRSRLRLRLAAFISDSSGNAGLFPTGIARQW